MTSRCADVASLVTVHLALIAPDLSQQDRVTVLAHALGLAITNATWPQPPTAEVSAVALGLAYSVSIAQYRHLRSLLRACEGEA